MICPNCGKDVPDGRKECPYCLRPLNKPTINNSISQPASKVSPTSKPNKNNEFIQFLEQEIKWFNVIKAIPIIMAVLTGIFFVVMSIGDGNAVFFLLGILATPLMYCIMKIAMSVVIIQTECLIKLAKDSAKKN